MKKYTLLLIALAGCIIFTGTLAFSADVLFVNMGESIPSKQVNDATDLFGLSMRAIDPGEFMRLSKTNPEEIFTNETSAIIITQKSLSSININRFRKIKMGNRSVKVLLMDFSPKGREIAIRWSGGVITDLTSSSLQGDFGYYRVTEDKKFARELSGAIFPFNDGNTAGQYGFTLASNRKVNQLLEFTNGTHGNSKAIFFSLQHEGADTYFLAGNSVVDAIGNNIAKRPLFELIPILIFFKNAFGDRVWHNTHNYANFTIDDPWLCSPYGFLNYEQLLNQMQEANFHTTIAFVPWNYDRSEKAVVKLFKEHPERYSIVIHGNNHKHREFSEYYKGKRFTFSRSSLMEQEKDIRQALARMERFKELTGIDYERVMIFPHGIAPEKTLFLLKKYNFLSTINSNNVPLGSKAPVDELFYPRSATLYYENFPSLRRIYPHLNPSNNHGGRQNELSQYIKTSIAIDLFLDNPVLFYAHHNYFKDGIVSFDEVAYYVNEIQPNIEWRDLGYITRHLYLQKVRPDGNYDIRSYSSQITIENDSDSQKLYYVSKSENFIPPIRNVSIDGRNALYECTEDEIRFNLIIPPGKSSQIIIEYGTTFNPTSIEISKNELLTTLIRYLSDFRDINMAKSPLGYLIISAYYGSGIYALGLKRIMIIFTLVTFAIAALVVLFLLKRRRIKLDTALRILRK